MFDRRVSLSRFMSMSEPKWKAKSCVHTGKARYLLRWKTRQRSPLSNMLELEFMFQGNKHNVDYSSLWEDIFHRWATQELLLSLGNNGATKDDSFRKCVNRGAGLLQPFNFWVISMQQEVFKGLLITTQHMSEGNGAVGAFCKAQLCVSHAYIACIGRTSTCYVIEPCATMYYIASGLFIIVWGGLSAFLDWYVTSDLHVKLLNLGHGFTRPVLKNWLNEPARLELKAKPRRLGNLGQTQYRNSSKY